MRAILFDRHPRQAVGFTLVELMVGVAIGMIGLLIVFRTFSIWDTHSRTTTAGGDAQIAGTLAMFNLERDIKLAGLGFGFAPSNVMGCNVSGVDSVNGRVLSFPLFPVQIVAGTPAGAPDSINVLFGNSSFFVTEQAFTNSTATTKVLARRDGFRNGDVAIVAGNPTAAASSADCQLVQITDTSNIDTFTVGTAAGAYVPDAAYIASGAPAAATSQFNAAGGTGTTFTAGTMYSLGPQPQLNRWQTDGRALSRTEYLGGTSAMEVSEGVINMKAEYGVDTDNDNIVAASEWTTATPTDWTKVRAIRVAILVRSTQFEKPQGATAVPATPVNPTWMKGDGSTSSFLMTNVDGTADSYSAAQAVPNNWRYYRYTVYEKVVPLRNIIWATAP